MIKSIICIINFFWKYNPFSAPVIRISKYNPYNQRIIQTWFADEENFWHSVAVTVHHSALLHIAIAQANLNHRWDHCISLRRSLKSNQENIACWLLAWDLNHLEGWPKGYPLHVGDIPHYAGISPLLVGISLWEYCRGLLVGISLWEYLLFSISPAIYPRISPVWISPMMSSHFCLGYPLHVAGISYTTVTRRHPKGYSMLQFRDVSYFWMGYPLQNLTYFIGICHRILHISKWY